MKDDDGDDRSWNSEGKLECEWDIWEWKKVKIMNVLNKKKSKKKVEEKLCEKKVENW